MHDPALPAGHWLAERVRALLTAASAADPRAERSAFVEAVTGVVDEIAHRDGIAGCFAAHEGLLVATAGASAGFERLAAMAQHGLEPAREAADGAGLGPLRQMLLVGERRKLALLCLGPLTLGILASAEVDLARTLAS